MLSREENDLITQTGPGTPGGDLMRRYWQPVALREELPEGGAPIPVKLLSEDLVLFRDDQGRPGLLGLHCPHRGTDLSYGRLEDGGLRCLYHGWLFDVEGRCLEQPGEPPGSDFCKKIQHLAYPCMEAGGMILTYMGPGEPPLLPNYEFIAAPESYRYVFKYAQDCNYLQGNEGNLDPNHTSFLHRMLDEALLRQRREFAVKGSTAGIDRLYGEDGAPIIDVEETDFGLRICSIRKVGDGQRMIRITNFMIPNLAAFPGPTGMHGFSAHWHVPIDDTRHMKYTMLDTTPNPDGEQHAMSRDDLRQRITGEMDAEYRLTRNIDNRYEQDREEIKTRTYAGLGLHFGVHDGFATETPGAIQDRTLEHLGSADTAVIQARRILLRAIRQVQAGDDPPHVLRDGKSNDLSHCYTRVEALATSSDEWRTVWEKRVRSVETVQS